MPRQEDPGLWAPGREGARRPGLREERPELALPPLRLRVWLLSWPHAPLRPQRHVGQSLLQVLLDAQSGVRAQEGHQPGQPLLPRPGSWQECGGAAVSPTALYICTPITRLYLPSKAWFPHTTPGARALVPGICWGDLGMWGVGQMQVPAWGDLEGPPWGPLRNASLFPTSAAPQTALGYLSPHWSPPPAVSPMAASVRAGLPLPSPP